MARRSNAARRDASAARRREGIRSQPLKRAAAAAVALLALACCARAADPPGSPRANQALAVCLAAAASPEERRANLARGLALAEEAVAADERDAKAHFAVFCNLGNDLKLRGVALQSLFAMRRLRREIDRTLELAPDYADGLVGKGELLCELPRLLGGDAAEGERLLRAALRVDPGAEAPRTAGRVATRYRQKRAGCVRRTLQPPCLSQTASWHASGGTHMTGFVPLHTPAWQVSVP